MGFRIEHRLGVPASASDIWALMSDIDSWPAWAGLYPQASGALRIGGTIRIVEQVGAAPPRSLEPTIIDWEPESQILWKVTGAGGMLKRTRYMEIDRLTETGCIISNGEVYDGFASRYVTRRHKRALYLAFEAFNEALRDRVAPPR